MLPAVVMLAPSVALASAGFQDMAALRAQAAEHLLVVARQAYPDFLAQVETGKVDPRLRLAACPQPEFELTAGSTPHGQGHLAIRCREPVAWSFYLGYRITLVGEVLVARSPLPARSGLPPGSLELRRLTLSLPPGQYFQSPSQLRNSTLKRPLAAGQPVTLDSLRREPVIRAQQRVRLVVSGQGFQVSQEGTAQNAAHMGDPVSVKMPSGRVLKGVAEADGSVRVP